MRNLFAVVFFSAFFSSSVFAADMAMHQHGAEATSEIHSQGVIKAWGEQKVTIAHQAIPALSWPPMTMNFTQPKPALAALPVSTQVDFSFLPVDGGYQLIAISASQQ
jgi:Cu(I)/Ag(I) efflux system protein CusF